MKAITPRLTEQSHRFFEDNFSSATGGAKYVLECTEGLFREAQKEISLDPEELKIIFSAMQGRETRIDCGNEIFLAVAALGNGNDILLQKLGGLTSFQRWVLAVWARNI